MLKDGKKNVAVHHRKPVFPEREAPNLSYVKDEELSHPDADLRESRVSLRGEAKADEFSNCKITLSSLSCLSALLCEHCVEIHPKHGFRFT